MQVVFFIMKYIKYKIKNLIKEQVIIRKDQEDKNKLKCFSNKCYIDIKMN